MQTAKQIIEKEISQSLENAKRMNKVFDMVFKAMGLETKPTITTKRKGGSPRSEIKDFSNIKKAT